MRGGLGRRARVKLYRLAPEAQCLVTEEFASGHLDRYPLSAYERFLDDSAEPLALDGLDQVVDEIVSTTPRHDGIVEQRAAPLIHRALPLSRREASQPGVWRFLAVAHRPDLVRHRWAVERWTTTRTRYWSPGVRHDSNVFSRLWWIAELTRDGDNYALTERVFSRQTLAIQIFIRRYAWHRDAVVALLDGLEAAPTRVVERVTRDLLGALGTLVLEALTPADLRALVGELRRDAERLFAGAGDGS